MKIRLLSAIVATVSSLAVGSAHAALVTIDFSGAMQGSRFSSNATAVANAASVGFAPTINYAGSITVDEANFNTPALDFREYASADFFLTLNGIETSADSLTGATAFVVTRQNQVGVSFYRSGDFLGPAGSESFIFTLIFPNLSSNLPVVSGTAPVPRNTGFLANAQYYDINSSIAGGGLATAIYSSPLSANPPQFVITVDPPEIVTTAVPEPATWTMMIFGLGLAGGVLRRRRDLATA